MANVNTEMLGKVERFIDKQRKNIALSFASGGSSMLPNVDVYQAMLDYAQIGIAKVVNTEMHDCGTIVGIPIDDAINIILNSSEWKERNAY